jgi:hypothetical protein
MITGGHLMVGGLIRFRQHGQVKVFPRWLVIRDSLKRYLFGAEARFQFAIQRFRLFFPADATVYLSRTQCAGRVS